MSSSSPVRPAVAVPAPLPPWRSYLALLLPMTLTNALQLAAGTLDNVFLGHMIGTAAVAAAAAFFPVFFLLLALVMGLATGATVLVGQAWGGGRPEQARTVFGTAIALVLSLSLLVMLGGGLLAPQLLSALGTPAPVLADAVGYARVLLLAAPVFFLLWLAASVSRAVGDALSPLHALLVATVLGLLCTPALIDGWLGLPRLGVAGAAASAAIATAVALGWLVGRWHRRAHPLAPDRHLLRAIRFDGTVLRSMLRIGVPSTLQMLALALAEILLLGWINRHGVQATAAYGAVNQVMGWVQLPAMSLGITATILAAQAMGGGRRAQLPSIAGTGIALGLALLGAVVAAVYLLAPVLLRLFLDDADVRLLAVSQLHTVAWGVLAMGVSAVLVGVMRGSGAVVVPALVGVGAIVAVELPLAAWLQQHHGLPGLWWAWPLGLVAVVGVQGLYFRSWRAGAGLEG
ncbi:MATE family efflux transporter [Stenotrophomonas sp. 24(2023)]|uniref:MATE family efflux transporter n=1 Tax=Stenotrophomonas sp. 24(2023) TaxID=3068324 RepID=UPI0027E14E3D|nr:MATE family efflux transporter [Stenotrophomonas sp. 24(2023)]WMJ69622.1 MATE family efflux transporter [Stenotrophomonas sp. 24(2023)]